MLFHALFSICMPVTILVSKVETALGKKYRKIVRFQAKIGRKKKPYQGVKL